MANFMNDFAVFSTAIITTIKNFINQFFSNTILGEIFLFVIIASIFITIIYYIISLGHK